MTESWDRSPSKVAVVDDDPAIREVLQELLHEYGFQALPCHGSKDLIELKELESLDLAIIDLKLDGESGMMLAQRLRTSYDFPIILLTGTGDEVDKIVGLETGADDFLMKPFNPRELIARIRAVLRRYKRNVPAEPEPTVAKAPAPQASSAGIIPLGELSFICDERRLLDTNLREVNLTNSELRLLEFLIENPNRPIDRVELLEHLGGDLSRYMDRTVDVLILRLRRKIEANPSKPVFLQTRRGKGYVFALEDAAIDLP
ncbi:two-component system, OmpR family, phosphate regulon response regulator OmpR [Pseudovibrio denitrificans]|uniref:Two-component system, OmpR family, phosphate regulon response regulator OmpR n=1 Tax=Pseudovibrio denitrificans TaxID=258256 RepID=A0A1I7D9L8_9HYPH|nr:response regulator transcription factor [Pseudovibrio denitrificans]SFU08325.1 two-component system, OmpR family, phosphate regulon response regulator OmpR [Pseudovibrio denitrificans]